MNLIASLAFSLIPMLSSSVSAAILSYKQEHTLSGPGGIEGIQLNNGVGVRGLWTYRGITKAFNPKPGWVVNNIPGSPKVVAIPGPALGPLAVNSMANKSHADATVDYSIMAAAGAPGTTKYTGTASVVGHAFPEAEFVGRASSSAFSRFELQGWKPGAGAVPGRWETKARASASGSTSGSASTYGKDPIDYRLVNETTGAVKEGTILDIPWAFQGDGEFTWENNIFALNAQNAEFHIRLGDIYVKEQGQLDLVVVNGIITQSFDDGVFDGWLNSVPISGAINIVMPSAIDFTLDFSALENPDDWTGSLGFYVEGNAEGVVVPEPSTFLAGALLLLSGMRALQIPNRKDNKLWSQCLSLVK